MQVVFIGTDNKSLSDDSKPLERLCTIFYMVRGAGIEPARLIGTTF